MEILSSRNFDDVNWQMYFDLLQEIDMKYNQDNFNPERTVENIKEITRGFTANENDYNLFLFLDNNIPVAWFDTSIAGNECYFGFDVSDKVVPEFILKFLLGHINKVMLSGKTTESFCFSFRQAVNDAMKKINAPVQEEMMRSRLNRENMDILFYESIIKGSELNKLGLIHCNEVPSEYLAGFVDCLNVCFEDMAAINPYKIKHEPLKPEEWIKDKEAQRKIGTELEIFLLLDSFDKISGFCWVCVDSYRKEIIRHNGGLTAVAPEFRGNGISRFLKAHLYLYLLKYNMDFKYITTDTMPWNTYMYNINREFGFIPYKKACSFKLTNEFIKNYLNL